MIIPIFINTGGYSGRSLYVEVMDEVIFTWKFWVWVGPLAIFGSWLLNQGLWWWVTGEWYWLPYFLRN